MRLQQEEIKLYNDRVVYSELSLLTVQTSGYIEHYRGWFL